MAIIKTNILPDKILKALREAGIEGYEVGSVWVKVDNYYPEVTRIVGIEDGKYGIRIRYQKAKDWEATQWGEESSTDLNQWKQYYGVKLDKPFSEYRAESLKVIAGEISIDSFEDKSSDNVSSETALVGKNSKDSLTALQVSLEEKKKKVELVKMFVGYEMEKKKRELDKIKDRLNGVLKVYEKKIQKIMRVITTIELYLGIDEELFQLQEGPTAPQDTPISFRQMVLFMDEETAEDEKLGKVNFGGLDFQDIGKFDEWILKNENFKKLLPEQKGMLVFKPRRYSKDYGEGDPMGSALKNAENKYNTYFLIRNGENLYRIFTEKIVILDRLFPQRKELDKLLKETAKIMEESRWDRDKEEAQDKVENAFYRYKKQAVFLQGLIDRTQIFNPLPRPGISVFKMEENEDCFNFIYDDELSLPSGRLPFWDWVKKENEKIDHGSRIAIVEQLYKKAGYNWSGTELVRDRAYKYYDKHNTPSAPKSGIYEVELFKYFQTTTQKKYKAQYKQEELEKVKAAKEKGWELVSETDYTYQWRKFVDENLVISYNPGGEVAVNWGAEWRERKNKIKLKIDKTDEFILNYDQISLDDIEFYLYNRTDRKNYLEMIPMLRTLKKWRLKELEQEKEFVKMVVGQLLSTNLLEWEVEKKVWELVEWWKFKNKVKRPIDKDDAKALRMIVKRFKSLQKEKITT